MKTELESPSFELATEWLNRRTTARQTKGHPTLVHFWSVSSETAKTNLAQVAQLRDQRKREGLRVVAVHVPQSDAEKDPLTVRDAIARLNLTEPCALDNDYKVSHRQENLPAYFLFDPEGEIRASATGANGLDTRRARGHRARLAAVRAARGPGHAPPRLSRGREHVLERAGPLGDR